MIQEPKMLMIGAAGRNAGKTELACRIIRNFSREIKITGIKVTAVDEGEHKCPRGPDSCGVCSSLEGPYCITEESEGPPGKDTSKLFAAGAEKVFWLRVKKDHLEEGFMALNEKTGPDVYTVCESNSLRLTVKPGLFLVLKGNGSKSVKKSCRKVINYADRTILSDGKKYEPEPEDIFIYNGKWSLLNRMAAIIMAGGQSSRMGKDKSLLPVNGKPMIQHIYDQVKPFFQEIMISSNEPEKLDFLNCKVIPDQIPGQGPLMGILSALEVSSFDLNFIAACDIPFVDMDFVNRMIACAEEYDAVVPVSEPGRYEPLFAVYRKSFIPVIKKALSKGRRKISDILKEGKINYIKIKDSDIINNLNTIEDYNNYLKREHIEA